MWVAKFLLNYLSLFFLLFILLKILLIKTFISSFKVFILLSIETLVIIKSFLSFWILFWDIIAKFFIISIAYLVINLTFAKANICCILSIILLLCWNMLMIVISKLLWGESRVTIIAIVSQIFLFSVIVDCRQIFKKQTSAKYIYNLLSKPF